MKIELKNVGIIYLSFVIFFLHGCFSSKSKSDQDSTSSSLSSTRLVGCNDTLSSASITFNTGNDDKDHNTLVHIRLLSSSGSGVVVENQYYQKFKDSDSYTYNLPLTSFSFKRDDINKGLFQIMIEPDGNDTWIFTADLSLNFADGITLKGRIPGEGYLTLTEDDNNVSFQLNDILLVKKFINPCMFFRGGIGNIGMSADFSGNIFSRKFPGNMVAMNKDETNVEVSPKLFREYYSSWKTNEADFKWNGYQVFQIASPNNGKCLTVNTDNVPIYPCSDIKNPNYYELWYFTDDTMTSNDNGIVYRRIHSVYDGSGTVDMCLDIDLNDPTNVIVAPCKSNKDESNYGQFWATRPPSPR